MRGQVALGASERVFHALAAAALVMLGASCGDEAPGVQAPQPVAQKAAAATASVTGPVCQGTGAHDTHATIAQGCITCHPCGGTLGFPSGQTLPSGRPLSGTVTQDASGASCSVTCHTPVGSQQPTSISWTATGPLACSGCHAQGSVVPAGGSSHPVDTSSVTANRTACQSCHDLSNHVSGNVRVKTPAGVVTVPPGGSVDVNPVCESCHLGTTGVVLDGETAPKIPGWTDAVSGDFHGARKGTGSGGTLAPPYMRGQDPIACTACHDAHQSSNAFIFTSTANGQAVPPGTIVRAGVGAEGLCTGCHQGARHAYCLRCHTADPEPAGAPCLYCHGHEGIVNFPWPTTPSHGSSGPPPNAGGDCWHCHNPGWAPVYETVPPVISAVNVVDLDGGTATITWTTNEPATSFVEYGVSDLSSSKGDRTLTTSHRVVLSGLQGLTTYQFHVRSSDGCRNVSISTARTFQTGDPSAPLPPILNDAPSFYTYNDVEAVTLTWIAVTSPVGNPVQYQVQVVAPYAAPLLSPWLDAPQWPVGLYTLYWPDTYTWRVMARDKVTGSTSAWSNPGSFWIWYWDY